MFAPTFRRSLLLAAMALCLPLAAPPAPARTILAAVPISRMDLPWWRARHDEKLREIAEKKPNLIFLGDSITQDWEYKGPPAWMDFAPIWKHFYGDRNAVNLGFKGDTTASLIWRIRNGEVSGINPKAAVIMIGANNMGRPHWSAEDTVAGIDTIIADLRQRLPHTRILLLGVLPSDRSAWITETTKQINAMLAKQYKGSGDVTYMDVSALFMRGDTLDKGLFLDPKLTPPEPPLHPTPQGQELIARAIEPVLSQMLGDRPHT
ncbi:MAG TPA: GDSL-type esterase/lipase family protein [Rhodopila sp.]|uniref:GDSL-type esterase/lipase family protein n=1 Tax=Rhodopila sp. TaxID=2480087 RepID=UPI002CB41F3A|nr:GDSL-type esterase/lipase family protein [Rhodopila sp.]HVY13937.1 GDSL-type esterase/lipase family protein [Rhodopila sp.]